MSESLNVFAQAIRIESFDGFDNANVERHAGALVKGSRRQLHV